MSRDIDEKNEKDAEGENTYTTEFLANDRKFNCLGCSDKALWLSFEDFFSSPCASKDFIEIVKTFEWVFINNFHACNDEGLVMDTQGDKEIFNNIFEENKKVALIMLGGGLIRH